MRGGIFQRLLLTYILVLVVVIGFLGITMSQFFKVYFFNAKQNQLIGLGKQVETLLIRYNRGELSKTQLNDQINTIGHATNSRIIVFQSSKPGKLLDTPGINVDLRAILQDVLSGTTVVKRQQFASDLNTYVVVVGLPVSTLGERKGAVLLYSPVYEVGKTLSEVYIIIWVVTAVSLLAGFGVVWLISRKLSRPIIDLSQQAEQITCGRAVPDMEIPIGGEIGLLVSSFNSMKNQLAKTDKLRREFIAAVSHDLRTPLTSIRGYIQGILDGIIPKEEQAKYLKLAFGEINRLTRMTNDLLELGKIEAGVVQLHKVSVVLRDLLEESLFNVRENFSEKGIAAGLEIVPADLQLVADPDRLKQIFINLFSNCFKYTPAGGQVKVNAFQQDGSIKVLITDTGIGIPVSELHLIFEKFYRVDKSRGSSQGGTGLGLSIAKNLVELHGGSITVSSVEGKGTCFELEFPHG